MKPNLFPAITAALTLSAISAQAQNVVVTANLSDVSLGGGNFAYNLTLQNTGFEDVNQLWLGWVPGVFNIANPTAAGTTLSGWTGTVIGNSIQFDGTSGNPIPIGGSGTFTFDSTSIPAQFMSGAAGTSWVYGVNYQYYYGSFGSYPYPDMAQITLHVVPEPSTIGLFALGALGSLSVLRRRA